MNRANNNRRHADSRKRQLSLLLAVMWMLSFLQPCLMAAGGTVYASFSENHQVHQQSAGENHHRLMLDGDQHREAGTHGDHQESENCPAGHPVSDDCCPELSSCCSDLPSYIGSLPGKVDSKDLDHKLTACGFTALLSLESQAAPARQFFHSSPELFPPGPSIQSKYRVYLK